MAFRYSGDGWQVADAIRTFGDQIMEARGHTNSYKVDGTLGDADHQTRRSDHNPDENGIVRALDFYEHTPGFVDQVGEALRQSEDPRIRYFIHDRRIFASYQTSHRPAWEWGAYTGDNGHETHGHLSVLPLGDNDPTRFHLTQGDDDMELLIKVFKGQTMAFYRDLQSKVNVPRKPGNPDYWGSDYTGQGPSDDEWAVAVDDFVGAVIQLAVWPQITAGTIDQAARDAAAAAHAIAVEGKQVAVESRSILSKIKAVIN